MATLDEVLAARRDLPAPVVRRALRRGAKVSLAQVADEIGVTAEAVRLWELGRREPRAVHLPEYVRVLELLAPLAGRK